MDNILQTIKDSLLTANKLPNTPENEKKIIELGEQIAKDLISLGYPNHANETPTNTDLDDLTSEFIENPDKALWFLTKVFPSMHRIFEDFDPDTILAEITNGQIKSDLIRKLAYNCNEEEKATTNSYNLTSEFIKNPNNALWLINKVFPVMTRVFDDFDTDVILNDMTEGQLNIALIRKLAVSDNYKKEERKQQQTPKQKKQIEYVYHYRDYIYPVCCSDMYTQYMILKKYVGSFDTYRYSVWFWNGQYFILDHGNSDVYLVENKFSYHVGTAFRRHGKVAFFVDMSCNV